MTIQKLQLGGLMNSIPKNFSLVEAATAEEAAASLSNNTLGSTKELVDGHQIISYPDCPLLHKNSCGNFICGKPNKKLTPDSDEPGEYGRCVLSGIEFPPTGCPIKATERIYADRRHNPEAAKRVKEATRITKDGLKVLDGEALIKGVRANKDLFGKESW